MKYPDMTTICGHWIYFDKPEEATIDLEDLRIHTSNICRYNGAIDWKLQQHLMLCLLLAQHYAPIRLREQKPTEHKIQIAFAAAHDLHEVYVTDLVSGLKRHLPDYRAMEALWENRVHESLGLPLCYRNEDFVKYIDMRALAIETTCIGHPGAEIISKRVGGYVDQTEIDIFNKSWNYGGERPWREIISAIKLASELI